MELNDIRFGHFISPNLLGQVAKTRAILLHPLFQGIDDPLRHESHSVAIIGQMQSRRFPVLQDPNRVTQQAARLVLNCFKIL
jgi:hypothetical protein